MSQDKLQKRKHGDKSEGKSSHKRRKVSATLDGSSSVQQMRLPPLPSTPDAANLPAPPQSSRPGIADTDLMNETSICPFRIQRTSFYLPVSPIYQQKPLDGLCAEHLSPLVLTYYHPLNGIVLSYSKPRLSNQPSKLKTGGEQVFAEGIDEYGVSYVWVTADFLILRPERGAIVEGHIGVQSESHLGLICWNLFNASINADSLPNDWRWRGSRRSGSKNNPTHDYNTAAEDDPVSDGHYVDGDGKRIEGVIRFRVRDFESLPTFGKDKNFISIEGTLLSEEEETRRYGRGEAKQRKPQDSRNSEDSRVSKNKFSLAERSEELTSASPLVNGNGNDQVVSNSSSF